MNTEKVTRFELIDHRKGSSTPGRVLVAYDVHVEIQLQDDDKTMKVFITNKHKES